MTTCRIDHYQTIDRVHVSIFAKKADKERSQVTFEENQVPLCPSVRWINADTQLDIVRSLSARLEEIRQSGPAVWTNRPRRLVVLILRHEGAMNANDIVSSWAETRL